MTFAIAVITLISLCGTAFALVMAGRHAWEEERHRQTKSKEAR